ncbi:hypothetical protein K438DRAFT_1958720 [Mycena galopus ATCC 62051]|nr:hypothetical protein K438DRAFT_1958720 [Mycena galopus ATCC 62051]
MQRSRTEAVHRKEEFNGLGKTLGSPSSRCRWIFVVKKRTHETLRKQWGEQAGFALNCALVSKDWNAAATNLLYRGAIRLCEVFRLTAINYCTLSSTTYALAELHLKGILLTAEQVNWLLGASKTLDSLGLNVVYAPSLPRIVGPLVKTLRLTAEEPLIGDARPRLASTIPMFTALKSLQLCGKGWLLDASLLKHINAPLAELVISWSPSGFESLCAALEDTSWQPRIRRISVSFDDKLDVLAAHPTSQKLRDLCDGRDITLRWFPKETAFVGPFASMEPR